jgi:purine-cytosine permease-like protein
MDQLITFLPLLVGLIVPVGAIICVWFIFKKSSSNKDLMLQQLMAKNKELEAKIDQLHEINKKEENYY